MDKAPDSTEVDPVGHKIVFENEHGRLRLSRVVLAARIGESWEELEAWEDLDFPESPIGGFAIGGIRIEEIEQPIVNLKMFFDGGQIISVFLNMR
jgi:hypothetical protein